ncbi:MAG: universal stress protein [Candidatus Desulfofervidaceae bacterium]|nr:universal stress protein [Candidatus Desulfofervidaceae bacterium]
MKTKKILYATNFKEGGINVVNTIVELQKVGVEEVVFLHVIEREKVAFVPYGGYLKEEEERLEEIARIRFENWIKRLENQGCKLKIKEYIKVGNPIPEILKITQQENADLVLLGLAQKRRFPFLKASYSPLIRSLVQRTTKPLLLLDKQTTGFDNSKGVFEHVLFPTDWSPASQNAFYYLLNFKKLIKKLEIVNVIREKLSLRELKELRKKLEEICSYSINRGVNAELHFYAGKITDQILTAAKDYRATSITMGTNKKPLLKELIWGSPSYSISEHAPVPTLIVP